MRIHQFVLVLFLTTAPIPLFSGAPSDGPGQGGNPALGLTDSQDVYQIEPNVEILADSDGSLTFDDILSHNINQSFEPVKQFGSLPIAPAYWLRLEVNNQAKPETQWLLIYDNYRISDISFYSPIQEGAGYTEKRTGNAFPFSSRDLPYNYFAFRLMTKTNSTETIYIRLSDSSGYINLTPLKIQSFDSFTQTATREYFRAGAYYFVILTVFLYNLLYIFSLRIRAVVSYTAFLLSVALVSLSADGFGHQFLWPNWSQWAAFSITLSALLFLAALVNYTIVALEVEKYLPRWATILKVFTGILVILVVIHLIPDTNVTILGPVLILGLVAGFAMPIITGIRILPDQKRQGLLFLLALAPYLILVVVTIIATVTTFHPPDINSMIRLALLWALLVFSLLTHNRINTIRKAHERAQAELIAEQEEALKIQTHSTRVMKEAHDDILTAYDTTLEGWARLLESRDKGTEGHSRHVTELTLRFASELGMDSEELVHIKRGALLHDIGKISVPDRILLKPGPLTDEEWDIMRQHPLFAQKFLSGIPYLEKALEIPVYHHEQWNGLGYPFHLKGEDIPLAARIFAIVDNWDALSSDRPYRSAWPVNRIIRYIEQNAGEKFDPTILTLFFSLVQP